MFKKINIDGREVELSANAATPFRFKQVFNKDLLAVFADEEKAQKEGLEVVSELAYIMSKQAEKADMTKLSFDDFLEWLEGFGPMAFVNSSEDIMSVYTDSTISTSTPSEEA